MVVGAEAVAAEGGPANAHVRTERCEMKTHPVNFLNRVGYRLAALLDVPDHGTPRAFAVFAHCFTCGKDLKPFARMNEAVTERGIAVLRFDFSGLGRSEGEFSESNFSSNETDIIDAAQFLRDNYDSPKLLIGHSMGGAAVVRAAKAVESATAVVTIAAPADPNHLGQKLSEARQVALEHGDADVRIGGQNFTLKRQFFVDLDRQTLAGDLRRLDRALLVLHSPADRTVEIENAARIFEAAKHPKSFVSLDGADHLLLEDGYARYAGNIIAAWADNYI